ncbi:probable disease resistance protein RPP1 [Neltuma alba]|uniref:probable disease resistance protein RPP1 n=1 Tax=Neltuma alba TaxID=207710 RepID=UPI0010A2CF67|nr:probable disease resistance protein RPP1 [Prosopis alba]
MKKEGTGYGGRRVIRVHERQSYSWLWGSISTTTPNTGMTTYGDSAFVPSNGLDQEGRRTKQLNVEDAGCVSRSQRMEAVFRMARTRKNEAELIEEIVNRVIQKLGPSYQSEDYLEGLIGIHKRMAVVESLLDKGSNNSGCQFIGIWGMGGLGKTTLAKALFNKLHFTYEGSCFLANVREESKRYGIDALREKIVWRLLGDKESHIGNTIHPYTISRLGRKKVFIVLDDVDDVEQLENLVGRHEFGSGSKILITTRDRQVLAGIKVVDVYVLDRLNPFEAFDLFSINAFRNDYADLKIRKLAQQVTQYADGNPLALKVFAALLRGKNQEGSIEGLIINRSEVEEMWVINKAFRSMHNLKFLRFYGNFNNLNASRMERLPRKLRLLDWVGCPLESLPTTFNGENLVEIKMSNNNLTKLWDGEQNLANLSRIDLHGSKDLIKLPNFSKAIHLAEVHLQGCLKLQNVHPSILSLHSLCRLLLNDCKALTSLTSKTHLKSLSELDLTGCSGLREFSVTSENNRFQLMLCRTAINGELCSSSGCLSKIDFLDLESCGGVTSLHKLFAMHTLRRLHAGYCNKLASNLRSIFDEVPRALGSLWLDNCSKLYEVPDNISFLLSLHELRLSRSNIETLPLSIKHLSSLRTLYLDGCERLRSLPQLPPSIRTLSANECLSLETLHSPLMSEGREGKQYYEYFNFINCMKLDGQSIKAVEAVVLLDMNDNQADRASMEYPGKSVAEWFMYRTTQSLVTVDLSSIPQPWDGVFIFCAVIPAGTPRSSFIEAKLFIDGHQCASVFEGSYLTDGSMLSDHVFLWYNRKSCEEVLRKIEEKKREAQSNTYHPLLQIQFAPRDDEKPVEIKECGVCPTSAVEYQNYIRRIQLALLHPHRSSNATQSASRKRKYHSSLP